MISAYDVDVKPALTIAYETITGETEELPVIPKDSVRLGKMTLGELDT